MSRVGKMPIAVPAGVTVEIAENNLVTVKGPKGELSRQFAPEMNIQMEGSEIVITRPNDLKKNKALHGLTRALLNNMVVGVTDGFQKTLLIVGVGYRASMAGKDLNLSLGYSHPITYSAPEGITIEVPEQTKIIVKGISKEAVGQVAAEIREYRQPEPYKGKGIKYDNEVIRRKVGKTGK
ncbi:MAG: 50S ribosomal protein L6 [Parasporobacterium sp.]|nr:50S ribosomal protein L6 [Parasporobacterium sp.]